MRTFVRCSPMHLCAYCTDVIRCCCCLQTTKSCSPCWVSSLTSTSARVTWPKTNWWWRSAENYTVICTRTPSCGTTVVRRLTYSAVVTGLIPRTYYQFRVTNDRARKPGVNPLHRTCVGTTSLYQSVLYILQAYRVTRQHFL